MDSHFLIFCMDDEADFDEEVRKKQDEFLDLYSLYLKTKLPWIKEELINKAYQLHLLDPKFTFYV